MNTEGQAIPAASDSPGRESSPPGHDRCHGAAGLDEGLGPVLGVTEADYDRIHNVNAKGAFHRGRDGRRRLLPKRDDNHPLRAIEQLGSPLGSRMGTADDVADAVKFFTSKLARWISGTQLLVSGGAP